MGSQPRHPSVLMRKVVHFKKSNLIRKTKMNKNCFQVLQPVFLLQIEFSEFKKNTLLICLSTPPSMLLLCHKEHVSAYFKV